MYRWVPCLVSLVLLSPQPAAAQKTYAEVVTECVTLFTPLVPVARAQPFVPDHPLGDEPMVTGNSDGCSVEFRDKDWASDKPGSAKPRLQFALAHGGNQRAKFDDLAKMTQQMVKKTYADVDAATFPGVSKAYRYTAFGSHWLVMLAGPVGITVQVTDNYPASTLDAFATLVLEAAAKPELRAWRRER